MQGLNGLQAIEREVYKMEYKYSREVFNHLDGIAYRAADNSYMVERYGADGAAVELEENNKTVSGLFDRLDGISGTNSFHHSMTICSCFHSGSV